MSLTKIEWTERTWNPVTGCTKISPGCKNCYAELMACRLQKMGQGNYANGFALTLQPQMLGRPLEWKQPALVFVNSMSDLFHENVPREFIEDVFDQMRTAHWHTFQVLTKRSSRLSEVVEWPANVWMGVSVESPEYLYRLEHLRASGARVKFVSIEPLLKELVGFDPAGLDWVIVGGESGPGARPMRGEWVRAIRDRCVSAGVPFFFKQWGGVQKHRTGRVLDGRTWDQMPEVA